MSNERPILKAGYEKDNRDKTIKEELGLQDKEVIIVEQNNNFVLFWKATLRFVLIALRVVASILIAALALVGVTSLVFPEIRTELLNVLQAALHEIGVYLGK